jgi:hypothetical protein
MRKQILTFAAILTLVVGTLITPTFAQGTHLLRATIPFDFVVRGKQMPAGVYNVKKTNMAASATLMIQSNDGKIGMFAPTSPGKAPKERESKSELVFYRIGGEYYLTEVRSRERTDCINLKRSQKEALELGGVIVIIPADSNPH